MRHRYGKVRKIDCVREPKARWIDGKNWKGECYVPLGLNVCIVRGVLLARQCDNQVDSSLTYPCMSGREKRTE